MTHVLLTASGHYMALQDQGEQWGVRRIPRIYQGIFTAEHTSLLGGVRGGSCQANLLSAYERAGEDLGNDVE